MSEEKTEKPTHKRLSDQRKEGSVPQRKYALEAFVLTLSFFMLSILSGRFTRSLTQLTEAAIRAVREKFEQSLAPLSEITSQLLEIIIVYLSVSFTAPFLFGILLNRFNFSIKSISPKAQNLNPINILKKLFSKDTIYSFIRASLILVLIISIAYIKIYYNINDAINANYIGLSYSISVMTKIIENSAILMLLVTIVVSCIDFKIQNRLFISKNKMSKAEIKKENKDQDGDHKIKMTRRSIAKKDSDQVGPMSATHVVYSEEYLVAVIYHEDSKTCPYVVMKARGASVARVESRYRAKKTPTFNLPNVAMDFFLMAQVDQYLPPRSAIGMSKIMYAMNKNRQ